MNNQQNLFFSILVPALNEAHHIEGCLTSLLVQIPPGGGELLLLDGGSTDGTASIAEDVARRYPELRIVSNPARLQSAGCNIGAKLADARSTILIRADAHASYPPNFVNRCLEALSGQNATSVVVPMKTVGEAGLQRAIAAAQNSILGNGGSRHRRLGASGFVDHGHHAAFDRRFFESIGGYDETFTHNEDAELDMRAAAAGGRIWLCSEAVIEYFPRSTYGGLARQYVRHGAGRARTLLKHRERPRFRQLLPVGVFAAMVVSVGGLLSPVAALPFLAYLAVCAFGSAMLAIKARDASLLAVAPALVVMHLCWAMGFLRTCLQSRRVSPCGVPRLTSVRSFFTSSL